MSVAWPASPVAKLSKKKGFPMYNGSELARFTSLAGPPVYRWASAWFLEMGRFVVSEGMADDLSDFFNLSPDEHAMAAADRLMALPAGDERGILNTYLGPPLHRFTDDQIWFTAVESEHEDNVWVADQCMEIHSCGKTSARPDAATRYRPAAGDGSFQSCPAASWDAVRRPESR